MTRTVPRYALRGATKAALLCAAIAAGLFVAGGGDIPEQRENENGTSTVQSSQAQTSGAELQSSGAHLRRLGSGRKAEVQGTQAQDAIGTDRNRAPESIGGTSPRSQAKELTIAAPQMPESARTGALPIAPSPSAGAASYTPCPKLNRGRWLKWEIAQRRDRSEGYTVHCDYGGLQISAGDANL